MKNLANSSTAQNPAVSPRLRTSLNRPIIDSVTLIYVPLYQGGCHRGATMGPAAMRVAGLKEALEDMGLKVQQEVEINVPSTACWQERKGAEPRCVPEVLQVSEQVAAAVEAALDADSMAVTIGGDHSLAIGSISGVSSFYRKHQESFGLVWFDAHGDINTPETSLSGNVHGMPVAVALGHGDKRLTGLLGHTPKVQAKHTVLIGTRDLDPAEKLHINDFGVNAYTMRDIDRFGMSQVTDMALSTIGSEVAGLHVSFDLDVMDPDVAPGVCLQARGGLNYREAAAALTFLAETGLVRSIDLVELNPAGDHCNKSAELAVELLKTALGQRIL